MTERPYAVLVGLGVGTCEHHACVPDYEGRRPLADPTTHTGRLLATLPTSPELAATGFHERITLAGDHHTSVERC